MRITTADHAAKVLNELWQLQADQPMSAIARMTAAAAGMLWPEVTAAKKLVCDPLPPVLRFLGDEYEGSELVAPRPVLADQRDELRIVDPAYIATLDMTGALGLHSTAVSILTARSMADELERIGVPGKHRQLMKETRDLRSWALGSESLIPALARPVLAQAAEYVAGIGTPRRTDRRVIRTVPANLR